MPKLNIDGKDIEVEDGLTLMQACEKAGIEIPHFCYHERLNIAGNCRMCLIEMDKAPKPVASCATTVSEGMVVKTNTELVKKAREGVMEFLLINHPLDCPICDQGGECDLQDQAFKYGRGGSRFSENKRSVKDKDLGPLVKTHMTRCIHCTRCVRFSTEIAGVEELGAVGRGEKMQITSYLEKTLTSELSGNVIDLCPVGALTSKPYAFKARKWELENTESIDVMDAVGSNIRIDAVGLEVMRMLPKLNDDINEEWLSDKARFSYDGLKSQRLDRPYLKKKGKLAPCTWNEALASLKDNMNANASTNNDKNKEASIAAIAGTTAAAESLYLLKKLLAKCGSKMVDANQFGYKMPTDNRSDYLFNSTIAGIEQADLCLIIGANIRKNAPVIGGRIGRLVRQNNLPVYRIGEVDDQTYKIHELGANLAVIDEIIAGKGEIAKKLQNAKNPMIIVGDGLLVRNDARGWIAKIHDIAEKYKIMRDDWQGLNILHNHASMVGALEVGFIHGKDGNGTAEILQKAQNGKLKTLYLLGADDIDLSNVADDCFIIYHGHHGDRSAEHADLILPSAAYTEQDAIYLNMEGRAQYARRAVLPLGQARSDFDIFKSIADILNITAWPQSLSELREQMAKENKIFAYVDEVLPVIYTKYSSKDKCDKKSLETIKFNYYMTDPISRNSATMARCTKAILELDCSDNLDRMGNLNDIGNLADIGDKAKTEAADDKQEPMAGGRTV